MLSPNLENEGSTEFTVKLTDFGFVTTDPRPSCFDSAYRLQPPEVLMYCLAKSSQKFESRSWFHKPRYTPADFKYDENNWMSVSCFELLACKRFSDSEFEQIFSKKYCNGLNFLTTCYVARS
jgi:hypothetical protein